MDLLNIMDVDICGENGLMPVFTLIGNIVTFIKIFVPILLIIFGSIDLMKAVMASKDDEIKKAQSTLIKRAIYAVVIFFIPTIISLLMGLVDQNDNMNENCWKCVVDPGPCKSLGDIK
ncbi:MAG: hypothetical protein IJO57_01220 [Bacilli bacterium]|nr:hypothetical protein [Bacilli bacterium]